MSSSRKRVEAAIVKLLILRLYDVGHLSPKHLEDPPRLVLVDLRIKLIPDECPVVRRDVHLLEELVKLPSQFGLAT